MNRDEQQINLKKKKNYQKQHEQNPEPKLLKPEILNSTVHSVDANEMLLVSFQYCEIGLFISIACFLLTGLLERNYF